MYGIVTVTVRWRGSVRTEITATETLGSHIAVARAMRHSRVPGTVVFEELLSGAPAPADAMTEEHQLVLDLIAIYDSLPGGLRNPIQLEGSDDDDENDSVQEPPQPLAQGAPHLVPPWRIPVRLSSVSLLLVLLSDRSTFVGANL